MKSERAQSSVSLTPGANTAPWHCHQMARAEHHSLHHDPLQIPNPAGSSFPGTQSPLLPEASTFWSETLKHTATGKQPASPAQLRACQAFCQHSPACSKAKPSPSGRAGGPRQTGLLWAQREAELGAFFWQRPLATALVSHNKGSPLQREAKEGLRPTTRC